MRDDEVDFARTAKELLAGGSAGTVGVIVGLPFDLIKVRLQVQPGRYKSGWHCLTNSVRQDGFKSLYRGMMAPVLSQMPINAVLFATEEAATRVLEPNVPKNQHKQSSQLIAGSIAGFVQCGVLVPFDRVKCLVQADGVAAGSTGTRQFTGTLDCARQILRSEGVGGFFKGFGVTALREVPSLGIYFTTYKQLSKAMENFSNATPLFPPGKAHMTPFTTSYKLQAYKLICLLPMSVLTSSLSIFLSFPRTFLPFLTAHAGHTGVGSNWNHAGWWVCWSEQLDSRISFRRLKDHYSDRDFFWQ